MALQLCGVRSGKMFQGEKGGQDDIPIHDSQEPDDFHAPKRLLFRPLGDMEQERVESQEDKANAYSVGEEKGVFECRLVDPSGHVEYRRQRTLPRSRV